MLYLFIFHLVCTLSPYNPSIRHCLMILSDSCSGQTPSPSSIHRGRCLALREMDGEFDSGVKSGHAASTSLTKLSISLCMGLGSNLESSAPGALPMARSLMGEVCYSPVKSQTGEYESPVGKAEASEYRTFAGRTLIEKTCMEGLDL